MKPGRLLALPLALLLLAAAVPGASAQLAEPVPSQTELRKLTKEAAALNKRYRGQLQELEEIRVQAKKATDRAGGLKRRLAAAEREVAAYAQSTYMGGPIDSTRLFTGDNTMTVLGPAAVMSHLGSERARQLDQVRALIEGSEEAEKQAGAKVADLKKEIADLKRQRGRIEGLLRKYGFQTPTSSDGLTSRMVAVRNAILAEFPMPYTYGCLRPGDPGDHGSGRACDFMTSRGGTMSAGNDAARGDALAQWCIRNGPRIGIMYIIWKQRYYDVRTGAGWRPMSDRGGVTANHWDHVHVSVF